MRKWKWIGHTLRKDRTPPLHMDLTGTHREHKGRIDQELPGAEQF
jgi:hypothetical protein